MGSLFEEQRRNIVVHWGYWTDQSKWHNVKTLMINAYQDQPLDGVHIEWNDGSR